ncbi:MAG: hypothetical protein U5L74_03460 [Ideonella sp.]|nr:hypothetical protein [Ideonella sp.]
MSHHTSASARLGLPLPVTPVTPGLRLAQLTEAFRPQVHRAEPDAVFKQLARSALPPTVLEAWSQLMHRVAELHDRVDAAQEELEALSIPDREIHQSVDDLVQAQWATLQPRFPHITLVAEPLGALRMAPSMAAALWCQMLEFVASSAPPRQARELLVSRRDTSQGSVFDLHLNSPPCASTAQRPEADPGRTPGLDQLLIRAVAAASGGDARISDCAQGARIMYAVMKTSECSPQQADCQGQAA